MICGRCGRRVDPKGPCRCPHPRPADPAGAYAAALRNLADNAGAVPIRLSGVEIAILRDAATELGQLAEARATITRLNRRCQIAEAAANTKVEDAEKRSKRGIRAYIFELGRMQGDNERDAAFEAIRAHRDARGDDRCWLDDETLYKVLPEGYTPPARDSAVELDRCRQYIASRQHPATVYVSPQRRIEELEAALLMFRVSGEDPHCWCGFNVGMGPHDDDCLAAKALIANAGIVSAEVTDATVEDPAGTGAREPGARAVESSDREKRGDRRQSGTDRPMPVGEGGAARGEEAETAGQVADPQDLVRRAIAICDRHDTWIADQIREELGITG